MSRTTRTARRNTLAGLIFCAIVIPAIYLWARNRQRNHGPVPDEITWWKQHGGVPRPYGSHYRHHD